MGVIIRNGIEYSGTGAGSSNIEYLTQAEYDALSDDKLTNGVEYRITDTGSMGAAENVGYNNNKSGLEAVNVQDAIDKLDESLDNINIYVGEDKKLHFIDSEGADTVIPFSSGVPYENVFDTETVSKTTWNDGRTHHTTFGTFVGGDNSATFTVSEDCLLCVIANSPANANGKSEINFSGNYEIIAMKSNETANKQYIIKVEKGCVINIITAGTGYSNYLVSVEGMII